MLDSMGRTARKEGGAPQRILMPKRNPRPRALGGAKIRGTALVREKRARDARIHKHSCRLHDEKSEGGEDRPSLSHPYAGGRSKEKKPMFGFGKKKRDRFKKTSSTMMMRGGGSKRRTVEVIHRTFQKTWEEKAEKTKAKTLKINAEPVS